MDIARIVTTTLGAVFLVALGIGFGPWPPDNIMVGSKMLGLPVWLECFTLAAALLFIGAVSAADRRRRNSHRRREAK